MKRFLLGIAVALFLSPNVFAMTADEVMKNVQASFLYPGEDFKVRAIMKLISKGGQERVREMTMLRRNNGAPGGEQKYFIYFYKPLDVKDMTFMVYKYPGRDADRWLFIPSLNMVRRIAAKDKFSSFVGSDFTYEDVSGRNLEEDTHTIVREENLNGRNCYVVKSTPKVANMEYSCKQSWIDKTDFLPLKEEYYDKRGEVYKVFSADETKSIKGFPTITKRTMKNLRLGHTTHVTYLSSDYNIGIEDSFFTERYLKKPLQKWIK